MTDAVYLLDSNICIYAMEGRNAALLARLADQDEGALAVSAISCAELAIGLRSADERAVLEAFLTEMQLLAFDGDAAREYARLPFRRGRFDRLIGAHALAMDLTLVTDNERDFVDIPRLRVENWTQ